MMIVNPIRPRVAVVVDMPYIVRRCVSRTAHAWSKLNITKLREFRAKLTRAGQQRRPQTMRPPEQSEKS
jgi:hypothetical protein